MLGNALIVLSIDPEAIRFPVGSNLAAKISPECPDSSITGACSPLVRGAYAFIVRIRALDIPKGTKPTAWMRALLPDAPRVVRARLVPTFCRFTTSWPSLGSSEAGLFSDMVVWVRGTCCYRAIGGAGWSAARAGLATGCLVSSSGP